MKACIYIIILRIYRPLERKGR